MHVVIILDQAHVNGGQAKVALDSAFGLKKRGHTPLIFAASGPIAPELAEAGIDVVCLDQPEFVQDPNKASAALRGLWNGKAKAELRKVLDRLPEGQTVVHLHGYAKSLSSSVVPAIRAARHPVLYTMHEYYLLCPNGGFYNYRTNQHCTLKPLSAACWKTQCDTRSYGFKLWRAARGAIASGVADTFGTLTDIAHFHGFQRDIIAPHLPQNVRLHEIANPVEAQDLGPKSNPAAGDFVFVGRLSTEKGCPLFAEAAALAGVVPTFVGDGPAAPELKSRFPQAKFLGWQDAAGVRNALRAARCLVFPSLWYEGQPLTVLESLAMGTPVIAGDGSAGRESVIDDVTGLWFRQADVADLARCIGLMKDDARATAMSNEAYRRYWQAPFTLERHVLRLEQVYGELLATARDQG